MISRINAIALITAIALYAGSALAIDVDRTLPISIESDSAIIDDSAGLSTYSGNVVISQGTTRLTADNISVFANERNLTRIVANGAPAKFRQQDGGSESATTGQANQITYEAESDLLIFSGDASLSQETNSFSGDRIEYDVVRKAIRAEGDEGAGTRVKIQYFPTASTSDQSSSEDQSSEDQAPEEQVTGEEQ